MKLSKIAEMLKSRLKQNEQLSYPIYAFTNTQPCYKFFAYEDGKITNVFTVTEDGDVSEESFTDAKSFSKVLLGSKNIKIYSDIYDKIEDFKPFLYFDRMEASRYRNIFTDTLGKEATTL